MEIILLITFWLMQIVAAVVLKYSVGAGTHWVLLFGAGNAINILSVWFMTLLYRTMNPNVAFGLAIGGAFLVIQIAFSLVFRSQLSFAQYGGLAAIAAGILLVGFGGRG